MQRLPLIALLALTACATGPKPQPWTVAGAATAEEARQALALVDAAAAVYPAVPLGAYGRRIVLAPEVGVLCYGLPPAAGVAGCSNVNTVYVRWPHGSCPDLTCSALPHELAHLGNQGEGGEGAAAAGALLIVLEYRRSQP